MTERDRYFGNGYAAGLDEGRAILDEMRGYEIETDIPGMKEAVQGVIDIIIQAYDKEAERRKNEYIKVTEKM